VENSKVGRRACLKWLAAGLIGAIASLKLKDVPKANAAPDYVMIGANNMSHLKTEIRSDCEGATLYVDNSNPGGGELNNALFVARIWPGGYALRTLGDTMIGGHISPQVDNKWDCGGSGHRWKAVNAGNVYASNVLQRSLSKFKQNIDSPTDMDYLSAIPDPIYFNWKDSDDKKRYLGFMGDYLPGIAKDGEGNVYMNSVIAILCGAVRQLKEAVDQLKHENEQLQRRIQSRDI